MKHRGFTLVELLVAIAIIGILAGFISSAIIKSLRSAAEKRDEANRAALENAIINYWHDYGYWPITYTLESEYNAYKSGERITFETASNANQRVFYNLHWNAVSGATTADRSPPLKPGNPLKRAYLDEKTFVLRESEPLRNSKGQEYTVTINFQSCRVTVKCEE